MGKPSAAKAKVVSSGPPQLYEEAISGPPFVVDVGTPNVWTNTVTAIIAEASTQQSTQEEEVAVTARWGHSVELSPNESTVCIIGGRLCGRVPGTAGAVPSAAPVVTTDLLAWTLSHNFRSSKASHVWQTIACQPTQITISNMRDESKRDFIAEQQQQQQHPASASWPHFAPWWVEWDSRAHEGERPVRAFVDGGWAAGRRLAGTVAFVPASQDADASSTLLALSTSCDRTRRSHHSVTEVQGVRYRFGGETQEGTVAALEPLEEAALPSPHAKDSRQNSSHASSNNTANGEMSTKTAAAESPPSPRLGSPPARPPSSVPQQQQQQQVPPPRAVHGACCLCQRYLLIFGGRRVDLHGGGADSGRTRSPSGKERSISPGKASVAGKAAARAAAVSKRGAPADKGGDTSTATSAAGVAVLTAHRDVAVYDTRLRAWLPVRVTGGSGPCARYAAAFTAVPTSTSAGVAAAMNHREALLLGGIDAAGQTCADAWLLQILSGADGELANAPAANAGTLPVVTVRWVRLSLPSGFNALAGAHAATPVGSLFARHHAAAVVSSQRIAYVVGGCSGDSSTAAAALPHVYTLALPHLTSTTVRVDDAGNSDGAATEGGAAQGGGWPNQRGGSTNPTQHTQNKKNAGGGPAQ